MFLSMFAGMAVALSAHGAAESASAAMQQKSIFAHNMGCNPLATEPQAYHKERGLRETVDGRTFQGG